MPPPTDAVYDPFARGVWPVGVRSTVLRDASRDRVLPLELWYPAHESVRGRDLDPDAQDRFALIEGFPPSPQAAVRDAPAAEPRFPLVVFSHGYSGHRRQTTHLCTHLASHGYAVASLDHTGNTTLDVLRDPQARGAGATLESALAGVVRSAEHRPRDVQFVLDQLGEGVEEIDAGIDATRVGVTGHSFGGWTALRLAKLDDRVQAVLPLAPVGGSTPPGGANPLGDRLEFDWERDVPTLYVVGERDTLLPLPGMFRLYERTPGSRRMVVLHGADHMHFCDNVEGVHEAFRRMPPAALFDGRTERIPPYAELCPAAHAAVALQGLAVAHMDAHLGRRAPARALSAEDLAENLAARGVAVDARDD